MEIAEGESGSLRMIQCIKSVSPLADYALVCQDIQSLLRQVNHGTCQFISRNGNKVAHSLASFALRYPSDMYWVDLCPRFISTDFLNYLVE